MKRHSAKPPINMMPRSSISINLKKKPMNKYKSNKPVTKLTKELE